MRFRVIFELDGGDTLSVNVDAEDEEGALEKVICYKTIKFIAITFPFKEIVSIDVKENAREEERCDFVLQKQENGRYLLVERNRMLAFDFARNEFEKAELVEIFDNEVSDSDLKYVMKKALRWMNKEHNDIF